MWCAAVLVCAANLAASLLARALQHEPPAQADAARRMFLRAARARERAYAAEGAERAREAGAAVAYARAAKMLVSEPVLERIVGTSYRGLVADAERLGRPPKPG
jgi:hypothetical protein